MEVTLSPELEKKIREQVGDSYGSPSDVIEEALKAFFGPSTIQITEIEDINRSIDRGLSDAKTAKTLDGDEARETSLGRLKARHQA